MDFESLVKCSLFNGLSTDELKNDLSSIPYHIHHYDKGEIVFHLMEDASLMGIILSGSVQAQKSFPNGSQINVSTKHTGEMIGPAAAFSTSHRYPCDIVAIKASEVIMFDKKAMLSLMQKNIKILENFTSQISSSSYMLQQRLELLSYSGIAQKAAFYLLTKERQTGSSEIKIPETVTRWALLMNVSRTSLHRELKKLEEAGLIKCSMPVISILDSDGLEDVLSI